MAENQKNQNLEKYLKDIATIKDLLADVEKRPPLSISSWPSGQPMCT